MATKGTVYIKPESEEKREEKASAQEEIKKLDTLASESETVLYEISSVFPFQLFPDKLIIDKNKVTVVRKELFFKRIFPILYEDLKTVKINRGIVFATIEFELWGFEENPEPVTHLWPNEASKAENFILGLVKAKRESVDIAKLSSKQIKKRIGEIGGSEDEVNNLF